MAEVTRPEEIAAALERWERIPKYPDLYAEEKTEAGDELARLLREAQPEPATKRLTAETRIGPGCVAPPVRPEPAAPAMGASYFDMDCTFCGRRRVLTPDGECEKCGCVNTGHTHAVSGEDEALFVAWDAARKSLFYSAGESLVRSAERGATAGDCLAIRLRTVLNHLDEARAALAAAVRSVAKRTCEATAEWAMEDPSVLSPEWIESGKAGQQMNAIIDGCVAAEEAAIRARAAKEEE